MGHVRNEKSLLIDMDFNIYFSQWYFVCIHKVYFIKVGNFNEIHWFLHILNHDILLYLPNICFPNTDQTNTIKSTLVLRWFSIPPIRSKYNNFADLYFLRYFITSILRHGMIWKHQPRNMQWRIVTILKCHLIIIGINSSYQNKTVVGPSCLYNGTPYS